MSTPARARQTPPAHPSTGRSPDSPAVPPSACRRATPSTDRARRLAPCARDSRRSDAREIHRHLTRKGVADIARAARHLLDPCPADARRHRHRNLRARPILTHPFSMIQLQPPDLQAPIMLWKPGCRIALLLLGWKSYSMTMFLLGITCPGATHKLRHDGRTATRAPRLCIVTNPFQIRHATVARRA